MVVHNPLVWIHAHEQLARLGKMYQKIMVVSDELLDRLVMTKISEIAEDGHEPFGFERVAVDVYLRSRL
jgi:bifunctional pyridoxal-dependent enzyme with beta-cystathionase and maltose regulon repressor activities